MEPAPGTEPYRVMVVDDSAVIRGLYTRILEADPEVKVVASAGDGQMAVNTLRRTDVDLVVLDIEMPVMDGLTALPKLLEIDPDVQVLMASTLTLQNADVSMKALALGAADYITKPSARSEVHSSVDFRRDLLQRVKALGAARRRGMGTARRRVAAAPAAPAARPLAARTPVPAGSPATGIKELLAARPQRTVTLRAAGRERPDVLAIGSSTGGPQALFEVLGNLKDALARVPVFITQHMPATFTTILAEHISRQTGLQAREGQDGEKVESGRVYIAPGNFHMVVAGSDSARVIRVNQDAPENFCRPAVDPMLRSLVSAYGRKVLVVILTGMGQDGMKGAQAVVEAGGTVIAQDEATSVVWGMPGAVATAGLCAAVVPLKEVGPWVRKALQGGAAGAAVGAASAGSGALGSASPGGAA